MRDVVHSHSSPQRHTCLLLQSMELGSSVEEKLENQQPAGLEAGEVSKPDGEAAAAAKLSFLDTYLSVWIILACGLGLGLGQVTAGWCRVRAIGPGKVISDDLWVLMLCPGSRAAC